MHFGVSPAHQDAPGAPLEIIAGCRSARNRTDQIVRRGTRLFCREFNPRLDGRVDERLRVVRDLHDRMMQSFQASLIYMQAARQSDS